MDRTKLGRLKVKIAALLKENKVNLCIWTIFALFYIQGSYALSGAFFLRQLILIGLMAAGVSIEMICGDFDLSFAAQIAASTVLAAYYMKQGGSLLPACILIVAFHAAAGVLKGVLIFRFRIPAIIMTLALQIIFSNLSAGIAGKENILFALPKSYYQGAGFLIPAAVLFILLIILAFLFLNHTYYGKYCRMLGEDMELVEESGLNCAAALVVIHVWASVYFAAPSIIILLQASGGSTAMGAKYLYQVLAAACIGGIGIGNGKGGIGGMLSGVVSIILILLFLTGTGLLNRWEGIIEGIIILLSVFAGKFPYSNKN